MNSMQRSPAESTIDRTAPYSCGVQLMPANYSVLGSCKLSEHPVDTATVVGRLKSTLSTLRMSNVNLVIGIGLQGGHDPILGLRDARLVRAS